jgi:hypothetical protein
MSQQQQSKPHSQVSCILNLKSFRLSVGDVKDPVLDTNKIDRETSERLSDNNPPKRCGFA